MSEPDLIRGDRPHEVTLPEGARLAAGKKAEASEPSVRKVLAGASPPITKDAPQDRFVAVPEAEISTSSVEQPTFDRQQDDKHALIDEANEMSSVNVAPMIDQALNDHRALLPPSLPTETIEAEVIEAPEASEPRENPAGPVIERSQDEHRVAVPENLPSQSPGTLELAQQEAVLPQPEIPVAEIPESSEPSKSPESPESPTPTEALARPVSEAAPEIEPAFDTELPEGTTKRLGQLKVENDKVRSKLDALQSLGPQPMHFSRH
jgi:hypothetical protein